MTNPMPIVNAITDALKPSDDARNELVALGMVVSAVICNLPPTQRPHLVEMFCALLRVAVAEEPTEAERMH